MEDVLAAYSTILVRKGDKGGCIQSRDNLSENESYWIYDDARVYSYAQVYWYAKVYGIAKVHEVQLTDKVIRGYKNVTEDKESAINL